MEESDNNVDGENMVFRLFRTQGAGSTYRSKCVFRLIPCNVEKFRTPLDGIIYKNGGNVLTEESLKSEHAISILNEKYFQDNPGDDCILPLDTFSSVFIYDVVKHNEKQSSPRPNLNKYRLTASGFQTYDANKILFQEEKWTNLVPLQKPKNSTLTAQQVISKWKRTIAASNDAQDPNDQRSTHSENNRNVISESNESAFSPRDEYSLEKRKKARSKKILYSDTGSSVNSAVDEESSTDNETCPSPAKKRKISSISPVDEDGQKREKEVIRGTPPSHPIHEDRPVTFDEENNHVVPDDNVVTAVRPTNETNTKRLENKTTRSVDVSRNADITILPNPNIQRPTFQVRAVAGPSGTGGKGKTMSCTSSSNNVNGAANNDSWLSTDDVSYNDADDNSDATSSVSTQSKASKHYLPNWKRAPFSITEGQRMLDLICTNNAFLYTKGNKLWELMENSEKFPGRTYQSLKEHFRKKVLPHALKAKLYKISPENVKRLNKAQQRANWTAHANVCPDYVF